MSWYKKLILQCKEIHRTFVAFVFCLGSFSLAFVSVNSAVRDTYNLLLTTILIEDQNKKQYLQLNLYQTELLFRYVFHDLT